MTPADKIIRHAQRHGLQLLVTADGQVIAEPPEFVSPAFAALVRCHRRALVREIQRRTASLRHLSRQILQNEFAGCSPKELRRLATELGL